MAGLFAKLFSGADVSNMESLCNAINELSTESSESAAVKVAELARKSREMFERKTGDIEAFLLHCSPTVGSAAMIAAIKAMFDTSLGKNNEQGCDRAVELLKHYLDDGQLVAAHLRHVPEIFFPLVRNVGFYCLDRKGKADIGQQIVESSFRLVLTEEATKCYVSSAHCALLACALKTGTFDSVREFVPFIVDGVFNENPTMQTNEESNQSSEGTSSSSIVGNAANAISNAFTRGKFSRTTPFGGSQHPISTTISPVCPIRMEAKYLLLFFYYSSLMHIQNKEYHRALTTLEAAICMPTHTVSEFQLDSFKKYVLVSLLVNGSVAPLSDNSPSVVRALKTKLAAYTALANIRFTRSGNAAEDVKKIYLQNCVHFKRDENAELLEAIVTEMQKRAVLAVAKIYSSIFMDEISELANLNDLSTTQKIVALLASEGKLLVTVDPVTNLVEWTQNTKEITLEQVEQKYKLLDDMEERLACRNIWMSAHPLLVTKTYRVVAYNDDEGLSMTSGPNGA